MLRAVLPDKGYTAHVLGFTAAALLEAHVTSGITPGQLDPALELLLPTLEGDLFGQVSSRTAQYSCDRMHCLYCLSCLQQSVCCPLLRNVE